MATTEIEAPTASAGWLRRGWEKIATVIAVIGLIDLSGQLIKWTALRTFRLLDGSYVNITSTKEGNVLQPVDPDDVEIFEAAWTELGQRALEGKPHHPTGITHTSHEYSLRVGTEMFS